MRIYAFECFPKDKPEWSSIINHSSRGKAKTEYWSRVNESWDIPFTEIRARKVGGPQTSEDFARNAEYRGLPNIKCGQRVKVGANCGAIVGHNSSANFRVLFDEDSKYKGSILSVHPSGIEII